MNRLSVYYPLKVFIYSWTLIFLVRTFGLMEYAPINIDTYILIILFIGAFIGGFFSSIAIFSKRFSTIYKSNDIDTLPHPRKIKHLKILIYICCIFSIICIWTMNKKISDLSSNYGSEMSLEGVSDLRKSMLNDSNYELGGSIYGVISSILFGFPVICAALFVGYKHILSLKLKILLLASFLGGIVSSFMTGGRFMAFTFILFFTYADIINANKVKNLRNKSQKIFLIIGSFAFIIISARIFLDRLNARGISEAVYLLPLCTTKPLTEKLLAAEPNLTAVTIYFEYYLAHGVNQLDVALNAPYPSKAPYLGAYSFKTPVLMLNKLGFKIIQSDEIVKDIVNPGVYFTEIGALYIDFGYVMSIVLTFIFSSIFGLTWLIYRHRKSFVHYFNCLIFLALTVTSSIVSLINSGYFAAILVTAVFLYVYSIVYKLPTIYKFQN